MNVEPQKEHQWLMQLVGEWTFESMCNAGPDQPPMKATGIEVVRSFGGLWTIAEGESGEGYEGWKSIMTLGYDPPTQRFVGTFVATMMTHLWVYDGSLSANEKVLTLSAEGPNCMGGGMAKYHDIIEILSDDQRTLSSRILKENGEWAPFNKVTYTRKK